METDFFDENPMNGTQIAIAGMAQFLLEQQMSCQNWPIRNC